MTRYIDAGKAAYYLEDRLRSALLAPDENNPNRAEVYRLALNVILGAPAADTERHARWLSSCYDHVRCSDCGVEIPTPIYNLVHLNYCPHCGAKMDR